MTTYKILTKIRIVYRALEKKIVLHRIHHVLVTYVCIYSCGAANTWPIFFSQYLFVYSLFL